MTANRGLPRGARLLIAGTILAGAVAVGVRVPEVHRWSSTDVWTGCYPPALEFAEAEIAEVLYYTTALGDADRARVERYLADRWSIVIP